MCEVCGGEIMTPSSASTYQSVVLLAPSNITHSHSHSLWMEHPARHASKGHVWYLADAEILLFEYFFFGLVSAKANIGTRERVACFYTICPCPLDSPEMKWRVGSERKTPFLKSPLCAVWVIGWELSNISMTAFASYKNPPTLLCYSEHFLLYQFNITISLAFAASH